LPIPRRIRHPLTAIAFLCLLTACAPTSPPPPLTRSPQTAVLATANPPIDTPTPGPSPTFTPIPTPTPVPIELVVCQQDEPLSLYLYAADVSARAGILDALFDGPIDSVGYAYQPVILQSLPSLENGGVVVNDVEVRPGDRVVDAATGAVTLLDEGVQLAQRDGSRVIYSGEAPALTVQVAAAFTLKPGLRWSDGQPLTADDSLFAFEIASVPDTPGSKFAVDRTARYEVVDALTTRWTGLPGWLDTNFFLRFWAPLPRHAHGHLSAGELLRDPFAAERPLSWGPFVVSEWVKGDHLTLLRNPHYFRAAEGLPLVDRVKFRFGLDAEAVIGEMLAGRCDIGSASIDFSEKILRLLGVREAGSLSPQFVSSTTFEHLDFGIQPAEVYTRPAGNALFQDGRVRRAVAYCLDRQGIVNQLFAGLAETPPAYLPAAHPLYAPGRVTLYPFDPAQGQALLAEAGWVDRDGDGIRDASGGGVRLSVEYASGPESSLFRKTLGVLIEAQLRVNCGMEVLPRFYAQDELYDIWPNGVLFGRKFDLGQFPWRTGIEPPCDLYLTEAIPSDLNPGGANNTGYSNPAFDHACRAAQSTLDEATRRAQHAEAQALFTQDLPSLPLFLRLKIGVALPRVTGYQLDATASSDLWNIEAIGLTGP